MMKKMIIIAVLLTFGLTSKTQPAPNGEYGFFYSNLAPYGSWIEIDYGTLVWSPHIYDRNWAPYTAGRWLWTSYGWYWDSYEPFGYITYHYGRWYFDDYYGWLWVPDYQWAPAWVSWRYNDNYIGWSPLPPYASFSINIGIYFTTNYHVPYSHWHFVRYDYFCDPYVAKYYTASRYKHRIFSETRYRNDYGFSNGRVVNRGVDVNYVRKRTNQRITERNINVVSDPRKIRSDRERSRDNVEIRTFIATRDELSRGSVKDIEIKRGKIKSSLQTSRIDFDGRNNVTPRVSGKDSRTIDDMNRTERKHGEKIENDNTRHNRDFRSGRNERNYREPNVERERNIVPRKEIPIEKRNSRTYSQGKENSPGIRGERNERMNEQHDQNRRIVPKERVRERRETQPPAIRNHPSQSRRENPGSSNENRSSRNNNERRR